MTTNIGNIHFQPNIFPNQHFLQQILFIKKKCISLSEETQIKEIEPNVLNFDQLIVFCHG